MSASFIERSKAFHTLVSLGNTNERERCESRDVLYQGYAPLIALFAAEMRELNAYGVAYQGKKRVADATSLRDCVGYCCSGLKRAARLRKRIRVFC